MKMKSLKEKFLKEKQQPNIYMQKTQGPKPSISSPPLDQRFKSHTLINKQNYQPNIPKNKALNQNSFGAVKMMMRQSVDDLKLLMNKNYEIDSHNNQNQNLNNQRRNNRQAFGSKSINFQQFHTERAFVKKNMKTEEDCRESAEIVPIIQNCQFIKSQYQQSSQGCQQQRLNYAKCYYDHFKKGTHRNNNRNILVHESLDLDLIEKSRDVITFGPGQAKHIKKYQFTRQEQKKMKNQIVNNIIKNTRSELMRSWDGQVHHSIPCVNHVSKKAKYRLNADLSEGEEESYYCSKCAINLIRQGFDIEQLEDLEYQKLELQKSIEIKKEEIHRQQEFVSIQKRIQQLKNKISMKLQLFSQKSEQMTKMDKRIELTVSNYTNLIEILKEMKKQELQKQQKNRKDKTLDINLKKDQLSTILNNIKDTSFQITSEKNKLLALKSKQFSFMFDTYVNKIASYENYLKNLQQTQISLQIATFDEHIDCQDMDEDTLIDNIFKQMFERLTKPKLEAIENKKIAQKSRKGIQLKSLSQFDKKKSQGVQSGGSSMFYCEQLQEQNEPPFRVLFNDSRSEESIGDGTVPNFTNNLNSHQNRNNLYQSKDNYSNKNIRYLKEEYHGRRKFD